MSMEQGRWGMGTKEEQLKKTLVGDGEVTPTVEVGKKTQEIIELEPLGELPELKLGVQLEAEDQDVEEIIEDQDLQKINAAGEIADSFKRIISVQNQLDGMKEHLSKVIDAMDNNPSILTRWANFWGGSSLIAKIGSGALVVAPGLIIGLAASIPGLIIFSGGTALAYSGAGILLGDHYQHNTENKIHLKEGVIGLVSLFESVIIALENLRHKLTIEVNRLCSENEKLAINIQTLHKKLEQLTDQVEALTLQNEKHKAHNEELRELTIELRSVEQRLEKRVKGAEATATAMTSVVNTMIENQSLSADQQEAFAKKLETFIANKEATFERLATRVCKAEEDLVIATEAIQNHERLYAHLNREHHSLVTRLERVMSHPSVQQIESELSSIHSDATVLSKMGIHKRCSDELRQQTTEEHDVRQKVPVTI